MCYSARLAPKDYTPYLFSPVWVVGCSLGLKPRPSQGIITSLGDLSVSAVNNWEISAPILPGNSGGPVFDGRTYQVIGIAVWGRVYNGQLITTMAGIVPIQTIYDFLTTKTELLPPVRDKEHKVIEEVGLSASVPFFANGMDKPYF